MIQVLSNPQRDVKPLQPQITKICYLMELINKSQRNETTLINFLYNKETVSTDSKLNWYVFINSTNIGGLLRKGIVLGTDNTTMKKTQI